MCVIIINEVLFNEDVLIGYHGSRYNFSNFDDHKIGEGNDQLGPGHYFFKRKNSAYAYSEGGYVYKCRLYMENILSTEEITFSEEDLDDILTEVMGYDEYMFSDWGEGGQEINKEIYLDHLLSSSNSDHDIITSIIADNGMFSNTDYARRFLHYLYNEMGIDGVIVNDWHGQTVYVVYSEKSIEILEQIKAPRQ